VPTLTSINPGPAIPAYACPMNFHALRRSLRMSEFQMMFLPVIAGLILLTVGFNMRERNIGVLMMWIGTLGMIGIMAWKILEKLN
jgi:hypothetical protein